MGQGSNLDRQTANQTQSPLHHSANVSKNVSKLTHISDPEGKKGGHSPSSAHCVCIEGVYRIPHTQVCI